MYSIIINSSNACTCYLLTKHLNKLYYVAIPYFEGSGQYINVQFDVGASKISFYLQA